MIAYDWQFVSSGRAAYDVAYLLALSLPPDDRRASEKSLLGEYWAARGSSAADKGFEADMRAAVLCSFASFAIGAATNGSDEAFRAKHSLGLTRLATAASDWSAESALSSDGT